jgi:hypothetical protein
MRLGLVASVVLTGALLACSKSEGPPAAQPPAVAAKPTRVPLDDAAKEARNRRPAQPLPTIHVEPPADAPPDPRRAETPCDRKEAGWKWVGTIVEEGRCVVGPCDCVKG